MHCDYWTPKQHICTNNPTQTRLKILLSFPPTYWMLTPDQPVLAMTSQRVAGQLLECQGISYGYGGRDSSVGSVLDSLS